ncbi:MAG: adenosylcobinamide-phosphate synthase CbiB [Alphaproteobacteria bacterium]
MLPFGYGGGHADPYLLLMAALVLDAAVGEMPFLFRRVPHPVVIIGRTIAFLDEKLNRAHRGAMDRAVRGLAVVALLTTGAAAIGWGVRLGTEEIPFGWVVELFLVVTMIAQRSLHDHVRAVARGLDRDGLEGGREAVAMICGRDTEQLDGHGVARAAIESCAENFSDGVVAPVFWYVLFGLPGLLVYKTVNTLDSMIGHRSERYRAFGFAAARLDDLMNLIPARLSGLYLALAAVFVPTARPLAAVATMVRDARRHRSPNSGWPEAAMAGALDLALAGPRRYRGYEVLDEWIGAGRREAEARDIARALGVFGVACLINAGGVVGIWLARLTL